MRAEITAIYLDLCSLRKALRKSLFTMTKADRIVYGTPALELCGRVMTHYAMAYDFIEERDYYLKMCWAEFGILRADLREIAEANIIKSPVSMICPCNKDSKPINPDKMKLEIFTLLGRIDDGISKWSSSIKKKARNDK